MEARHPPHINKSNTKTPLFLASVLPALALPICEDGEVGLRLIRQCTTDRRSVFIIELLFVGLALIKQCSQTTACSAILDTIFLNDGGTILVSAIEGSLSFSPLTLREL